MERGLALHQYITGAFFPMSPLRFEQINLGMEVLTSIQLFFFQLGANLFVFFYFGRALAANSSSSLWFVSCWVNQIICTKMYMYAYLNIHTSDFFDATFHDGMRLNAEEIAFPFCPCQAIVTPTFVCPLLVSGPRSFLKYIFWLLLPLGWLFQEQIHSKTFSVWYHWCHPRFAASNLALLGLSEHGGVNKQQQNEPNRRCFYLASNVEIHLSLATFP